MKLSKKALSLLLTGVISTTLLTGCSSSSNDDTQFHNTISYEQYNLKRPQMEQ